MTATPPPRVGRDMCLQVYPGGVMEAILDSSPDGRSHVSVNTRMSTSYSVMRSSISPDLLQQERTLRSATLSFGALKTQEGVSGLPCGRGLSAFR